MPIGIEFLASFKYDPFVKGANVIKQSVHQMSSLIQRAGGEMNDVFRRITDGGQTEMFERKAQQIAKVFSGLVGKIGLAGDAASEAKDRISKALDDMANSTERPKARFRKFAEEMSAILNEIRSTEAPMGNTGSTSSIASIERRLKLEADIVDVLEKQKAVAEQVRKTNAENYDRNKTALTALEERLGRKYNGAAEGFYSEEDAAKLSAARESVERWGMAWEQSNTAVQTCSALIDESAMQTEKARQKVDELKNVYKGFADTAESTSTKIFISEEVFTRYRELSIVIDELKEQIKEAGSQDDIDLPKLEGLQDKLASAQAEFRSLDEAARHTAEILGSDLAGKTSNALEKLYNLNARVREAGEVVARFDKQLKDAKRELEEARDPAAITTAKQRVDDLSVSLDKANDRLSRLKAEEKDAVYDIQKLSKSIGGNGEGDSSDIAKEVDSQVKSIVGNIAAIAGIGLGLSEVKDFFNQAREWRMYFQDIESSFKVFLGSAEKGAEFTEKLQKYAYYNMFEFSDLAAASQQMISYGHNVDSIIPRLDQLSNVATGTHGSLMELVDAYNRAKATGVVDARGVQSWAVKGVMIRDVLAEIGENATGTTITFEQLNKVLDHVTGEGGQFHNLMGKMMSNVSAEAGQLEDNLALMFNEVGTQYEEVFVKFLKLQGDVVNNYRDIGGGLLDFGAEAATIALDRLAENWRTIVDVIKGAVVAYGAFKAALLVHSAAVAANTTVTRLAVIAQEMNAGASYQQAAAIAKATMQDDLESAAKIRSTIALNANTAAKGANTAATVTLSNAIKGLTATMLSNPWVLAATAIAALAYACYKAYDGIMTQEKAQRLLTDAIDEYNEKLNEEQQSANTNISTIQNKTASLIAQTKAYRDLIAEHEIFAQFSKDEIANMGTEQIQGILDEEKAKKEETYIRNMVAAAEELQERFKGKGNSWFYAEDSDIDEVVKKFKLLPEYAEELKNSVSTTNLNDWANQLKDNADTKLQEYLEKEAEAGVIEGIKNGIANDSLKGDVVKLLSDYGKEIGEKTAEQEKALAEARTRLSRIESGEESFDRSVDKSYALKNTREQIEAISESLAKTRGEIGETFGKSLTEKAKKAEEEVNRLDHAVSAATGIKKTELQFQLKQARDEYDTLQSIIKLVEAGKVNTEVVMKVTRETDNTILGDERLAEIGDGYRQIDELGQKFVNEWAKAKEEMDAVGKGGKETAEEITSAWNNSSGEVLNSLDNTEEELSANIQKLKAEQDELKEKFGETYKDTEEYRKLEVEITRKKEQLDYLQNLKTELRKIAENPFSIWIDVKTYISDNVKNLLRNVLPDDLYKSLFGDVKTEKSVSQVAQEEGKTAKERIEEKNNTTTQKTGAQWKTEELKRLRADLKAVNDELKKPIDKKRYDELMGLKSQYESALKKGDAAAKNLIAQRAKLFDQQMSDIERRRKQQQDMEEAQADLAIASEQSGAKRELMQMEKDHKDKLEAIDRQAEEMRKANYEAQKKAWEAENAGNKKAVWADTATAKKVLADGNYSSIDLTKEQDATVKAQRKARLAENEREEKEYYDKIVAAHQSYADKKIAIDRKYNEDVAEIRKALAKAEASGNKSGAEALRRSLGETEKEHAKSQAQLSLEMLKDDPEYIRAFEDLDEASTATLEHLIKLFEESKSAAAKSLDPKDLREYTSAIEQMRDKLNERDPFKALTESSHRLKEKRNELKNAEKQLAQVEEGALIPVGVTLNRETMQLETQYLSLDDAQKRVREATGNLTEEEEKHLKIVEASNEEINSLADAIGNLGNSLGGQAGSILTLGSQVLSFYTLTTESITKLSKTGEAALSSLEKASVILTIISAAWQLAQGIMSLFGESEEERQARLRREEMVREMTASVEAYRLEVIRARQEEEKWLASSGLRDLADSWKLSSEAQKSYFEVANNQTNRMKKDIAHWETYDIPTLTNINRQAFFNEYYRSLEQFGHAFDIEITNEYDRLETLSSYIKRVYNADMFDSEGMLNTAVIDNFLESNSDRIQHDDEEILKTLNDLSKQYAEWRENLKKYVADQFGGFSDDLVDSLWAWYDEGSDVMESFRSNARDTFRGVASDMMKDLVNNVVFDQLKERLTDAFSAYSLNINSGMGASEAIALLATSVDGALGDFETTVEGQLPVLKSLMEQLGQMSDSLFGKADADDAKEYFNSIRDAWADTVMAMKGDSESLGKEIARIMFESLVASNIFNDTFDEWLKGWVASYNEALALEDEVARQERLADLAQQRAEKVDELTAATKEYADITGYAAETTDEFASSLDNLGDTLLDALLDTEKDAAAMGREIASTLVREMLQTMLASEQYAGRMEEIRKKWQQILSGEGSGYTMDDVLRDIADLNNDIANDEGIAALADQYRGLQKELEGTETAFGDLRGTFLDTLTDMEGDAEAFRRKLEEVMLKDLLDKQVLGGAFTAGLDGIVREFADFDDYAEQWNMLYADAVKEGNGEVIDALLDELAAVRGQMVESAEGLRERMKALSEDTTFKGMSDNFASALLDMDATAEDFGRQIGRTLVEKMVRELIVGKRLQSYLDDIQEAYDRASKDFEGIEEPVERTQRIIEAVTPSIDAAVAATEEWKPVVEAIAESFGELGSTPFDNMRSSFLSSLMDMESSTEDFARSIGEILTEAFIDKFVLGDAFDAQLESWQAEYRRIMGDTSMDDEERSRQLNALKTLIADYRDQMAGEAMAIHDLMGTAEYADQQATMNMADKITYEQADMLLGVNVAQQLIQQQILATLQSMRGVTNPDSQVFSDMRNLMFQANGHLTWIHDYSKRIYDDFSRRLASIDDKLSLLR